MRPAGSASVRRRLLRLSRPGRPCPLGETRIRRRYDLSLFATRHVSLEVETDGMTNCGDGPRSTAQGAGLRLGILQSPNSGSRCCRRRTVFSVVQQFRRRRRPVAL